MIISRTPLRISFFGGGSDIPSFYRREGGAVLSTAINKYVYVTVSPKFDEAIRISYSKTEEVDQVSEIEHPLVREALIKSNIRGGVEITSVADIPANGTGLGSSSSFTVGLLNALHAFEGRRANSEMLASDACEIEIERCNEPIGKQDQYAAAYGGFNFIKFSRDDDVIVEKVICQADTLSSLQERLLFFYTGRVRSASRLLAEQSDLVSKSGKMSDDTLHLAGLARTAFEQICRNEIGDFGAMLHEAWQRKRKLNSGVTNALIDGAYDAAIKAGAEGGKILGAGGGGFLMFLAPPERHHDIRSALSHLKETPFSFASQGSSIVFIS